MDLIQPKAIRGPRNGDVEKAIFHGVAVVRDRDDPR